MIAAVTNEYKRRSRAFSHSRSTRNISCYTYVVYKNTGEQQLYDRKVDPYELKNVASVPAYASIEKLLAGRLAKLAHCQGAACNIAG
jgi:hypothetical protein